MKKKKKKMKKHEKKHNSLTSLWLAVPANKKLFF